MSFSRYSKVLCKNCKFFLPTCIWNPLLGWPRWNFTRIFGKRKLQESREIDCIVELNSIDWFSFFATVPPRDGRTDTRPCRIPHCAYTCTVFVWLAFCSRGTPGQAMHPKWDEPLEWVSYRLNALSLIQPAVSKCWREHCIYVTHHVFSYIFQRFGLQFDALILLVGWQDRKGIWPIKYCCSKPQRVSCENL